MAIYLYKARKIGTKEIIKSQGQFESADHVNRYLISHEMVPLVVTKKTAMTTDLKELSYFQPKIKLQDIAFFCKQLGVMLEAGMSIRGALQILASQIPNITFKKKIKEMDRDIQKGNSLSDAIGKHSEFPNLLVSMIRSGEASGMMDQIMKKMAVYYDRQLSLKRTLKKSLAYPTLVLATVAIVIPILMIFVVPGFVEVFSDAGMVLPLATRVIIYVSQWMQQRWYVMVLGAMIGVVGIVAFKKSRRGKIFLDQLILALPIIGDLNKKTIAALFSETLSLLVTSGVPVFQSLEIVGQVLQNSAAKVEMATTLKKVREGSAISKSLERSKIYPPMMVSMLRIGEETGTLDMMLNKTGDYYNLEVEAGVSQLTILIEPLLMMIIAIFVGGIMMAIMLPTFTLATGLM